MNKVKITESDFKQLVINEVRNVVKEMKNLQEMEVVSQGSYRSSPNVDRGNEDVTRSESEFLSALAERVAKKLGLRDANTSTARTTTGSWDQVDFLEGDGGGSLTHNAFITLDKRGPDTYRVSADADTRSPDGVEEFSSQYLEIEAPNGLDPSDLTPRFVGRFADMLEDAMMEGFKDARDFGRR